MEFEKIKERLIQIDTSQICDVLPHAKILESSIKPINPNVKMVGVAHTINCDGHLLAVIKAIIDAKPNDVLVIHAGTDLAVLGEILATAAKNKEIRGVVIDGSCRDLAYLRQMDLPIYAKFTNPKVAPKQKIGATQIPITCGNIPISPSDIILGDSDGVVAISPQDILEVLEKAEALRERELTTLKKLSTGKDLSDLTNFSEYYADILRGNGAHHFKFK